MGSEAEPEPYSIPKLPLFSVSPHLSEPSGTLTPPLQTSASVPFQWEEQPGKPRTCTDLILASTYTKCLELPPRLAIVEITKTSSPTTVLDGPGGKSVFSSSSFRFSKERRRRRQMQGSFDSNCSGGWSPTDESSGGQLLQLPDDKIEQWNGGGSKNRRRFGSFRMRSSADKAKASVLVSPSSGEMDGGFSGEERERMRGNSDLSKVTRAHFWAKIYEGFKQVNPWRKKPKKESFTL